MVSAEISKSLGSGIEKDGSGMSLTVCIGVILLKLDVCGRSKLLCARMYAWRSSAGISLGNSCVVSGAGVSGISGVGWGAGPGAGLRKLGILILGASINGFFVR